ncbi:response regulator [Ramlibacter humi]|uniref:response regulator n=1 Tax=Ramlibacter humi TaxID=2530451 RepID=UPI001EF0CA78|nr:response regulator [Ramlibacter humi]
MIVEDDARLGALLSTHLREQGYGTDILMNGLQVEPEVRRAPPALVLLDATLPGVDGLEVCRQLRRFSDVPIIMASARADEFDRTLGLEAGADDYVCKPFSPRELSARIKALLRRAEGRLAAPPVEGGFRVDDPGRRIGWDDRWLPLTPREYFVLRKLLSRPGQVFTREDLAEGEAVGPRETRIRTVDSHVKNLRRKLAEVRPGAAPIASVYGMGYRFEGEGRPR